MSETFYNYGSGPVKAVMHDGSSGSILVGIGNQAQAIEIEQALHEKGIRVLPNGGLKHHPDGWSAYPVNYGDASIDTIKDLLEGHAFVRPAASFFDGNGSQEQWSSVSNIAQARKR